MTLEQLRDKKAEEWADLQVDSKMKIVKNYLKDGSELHEESIADFQGGWDAHETLNLPVLFMKWATSNCELGQFGLTWFYKDVDYTSKALYKYWITDVYKPE